VRIAAKGSKKPQQGRKPILVEPLAKKFHLNCVGKYFQTLLENGVFQQNGPEADIGREYHGRQQPAEKNCNTLNYTKQETHSDTIEEAEAFAVEIVKEPNVPNYGMLAPEVFNTAERAAEHAAFVKFLITVLF
jgi:hypothetical protein